MTGVPVVSIEGDTISCRRGEDIVRYPAGDRIVLAVGARPQREVSKLADEAGVPWVMVGGLPTTSPVISSPRSATRP